MSAVALKAITFLEFMSREVGDKWVVARCTAKARRRYPDSVFLTRHRFDELKRMYEQETGCSVLDIGR